MKKKREKKIFEFKRNCSESREDDEERERERGLNLEGFLFGLSGNLVKKMFIYKQESYVCK